MTILEWIYPKLVISNFASDKKASEQVATILSYILSSLTNFYSPATCFDKFTQQFEKMQNIGLFDTILSCLSDYASIINSDEEPGIDSAMIDTGGSQLENTYSQQTITLLISMLTQACKYSNALISKILNGGVVQLLSKLLPKKDDQDMPSYTSELIGLFNQILPQTTADEQNMNKLIVFGPRLVYPFSKDEGS